MVHSFFAGAHAGWWFRLIVEFENGTRRSYDVRHDREVRGRVHVYGHPEGLRGVLRAPRTTPAKKATVRERPTAWEKLDKIGEDDD